MSNPNDYAVGWICAIHTEYIAAQAFLDERHEGPEYISPNDHNDYTLGRMGRHNVVIAVLPDGDYGIAGATSVARDMLHSFPNVRIGLMVGIGGGAPSEKHDIRLGDIVVSASRDGKGAVFQYDFGKTIQEQSFQTTAFLNQPPMVLRTAVSGLRAQYESDGHQIEEAINSVLERKPRLRQKYRRPDQSRDRLYQSGVIHPSSDKGDCEKICGNEPSKLKPRRNRTEEEDDPAIHYGLIASANQLMKDAAIRDKLASEKDVLCFEMEAAGLMNHFPCLVIRGICDYSDSHKNKEWQGYAAMAAATYAKDLLCRIAPNKVEAEKKIGEILSDVLDSSIRTRESIERMVSNLNRKEDLDILNWITPIDYGPQQSDYIRRRQAGTGQWLLDSEKFKAWLETSKQTLFCPGIPGAGKTILTSVVIDDLDTRYKDDPNVGVAYLYCNFRRQHEQKVEDLLASVLKQLSQGQPSLPDTVRDLYQQHQKKRTRPLLDEISRNLQSVAVTYSRLFIIVDALDECQVSDGCRSKFLSEILNLQVKAKANIFVTSRFIPDIVEKFERITSLEIRASDEDVRRYLSSHISQLPGFVARNLELQEEITATIIKAVDGMFLLAQLHLDSLIGKRHSRAIKIALETLPAGSQAYDSAYTEAIERIKGQTPDQRHLALDVLSWITCAKRQLTVAELQHGLAVDPGDLELDNEKLTDVADLVSVCAGLVTIDQESNIIRLVHYTTQEFFERRREILFPNAEVDITKACVTYLSFKVFEAGDSRSDEDFEARLKSNALYDYAARNWGNHARMASMEVEELILRFLGSKTKLSAAVQALMVTPGYSVYSQGDPTRMTGAHLAAYFGLPNIIGILVSHKPYEDLRDRHRRTPLSWAAARGHEEVVKLLLAKDGVDVNSKDVGGWTALSRAAEGGHDEVVKLLLAMDGVDVNSGDVGGWTALSRAAVRGHEEVVKLLLAKDGVNVNSSDNHGRTALLLAAIYGYEAVVKLLLAKDGIDVNSRDEGWTALSWAAARRHEEVVKLLLAKDGVDVNSRDDESWTALSLAAVDGHEEVVKLLLTKDGVDVNSKDDEGWTALSHAASRGHEEVVNLLLAKDGDA